MGVPSESYHIDWPTPDSGEPRKEVQSAVKMWCGPSAVEYPPKLLKTEM